MLILLPTDSASYSSVGEDLLRLEIITDFNYRVMKGNDETKDFHVNLSQRYGERDETASVSVTPCGEADDHLLQVFLK